MNAKPPERLVDDVCLRRALLVQRCPYHLVKETRHPKVVEDLEDERLGLGRSHASGDACCP